MKEKPNKDYSVITEIAAKLGLVPYKNFGKIQNGVFSYKDLHAPIDLTACANVEISILKTALQQLSIKLDDNYQDALERSERD